MYLFTHLSIDVYMLYLFTHLQIHIYHMRNEALRVCKCLQLQNCPFPRPVVFKTEGERMGGGERGVIKSKTLCTLTITYVDSKSGKERQSGCVCERESV